MGKSAIISIEYEIPHDNVENISYNSKNSLFDADIIIFNPIFPYIYSSRDYTGKPAISSSDSVKLTESIQHWRRQLNEAYNSGKTIFIILSPHEELYIDIGYSSTDRSGKAKRQVSLVNSYCALPFDIETIIASGNNIKLFNNSNLLSTYWKEFSSDIEYSCYINSEVSEPLLMTKSGNKVIAASIYENNPSIGRYILIPDFNFDKASFTTKAGNWSSKATDFARKVVNCLNHINKLSINEKKDTPPPIWVDDSEYKLNTEADIESRIINLTNEISKLEEQRKTLHDKLTSEGSLRKLLYENGTALEKAIIESLIIFGFKAEQYQDSSSEFDVIFNSDEGILLGEAEGKDDKAINITKLRQLMMNRIEYFTKFGTYPKGVLFGNPQRLINIFERTETFTDKCLMSAKEHRFALILTKDLFLSAKYIKETNDTEYANLCRQEIFNTDGDIVIFPAIPTN